MHSQSWHSVALRTVLWEAAVLAWSAWVGGEGPGRGPSLDVLTQLREGSQSQAWVSGGARGIWSQGLSPLPAAGRE